MRDGVVLVEFPEASEDEANRAAVALGRRLADEAPPGFRDAIPAARTLLVLFDVRRTTRESIEAALRQAGEAPERTSAASRLIRIPVAYGGAAAADLADLARAAALTEGELARRHSAAEYRVAFLGFAPGFGYLTGLPPELRAARLPSPRPRVPAGSVAIGGGWTGVYPAAMPGGWRLIGRTAARLFDAGASAPALLAAGDRVRFDPVAEGELPAPAAIVPRRAASGTGAALRIEAPGFFATVQGGPRYGFGASGVPPGGAMDPRSLARANALVGNGLEAAALEIVLAGPVLVALEDLTLTLAGAAAEAEVDGRAAPPGETFRMRAGQRLSIGRVRRGARLYLAIEGGFVQDAVPGEPAARLAAGDVLLARPPAARVAAAVPAAVDPGAEPELRILPGPHGDRFAAATVGRFLSTGWRISPVSDRRGLRLEGEPLEHAGEAEVLPQGAVAGTIQVPGDGRPIVLGPDGPVTGGYPQIATVIEADLPLLGQAVPGDVLRFRFVTREAAEDARRE